MMTHTDQGSGEAPPFLPPSTSLKDEGVGGFEKKPETSKHVSLMLSNILGGMARAFKHDPDLIELGFKKYCIELSVCLGRGPGRFVCQKISNFEFEGQVWDYSGL